MVQFSLSSVLLSVAQRGGGTLAPPLPPLDPPLRDNYVQQQKPGA